MSTNPRLASLKAVISSLQEDGIISDEDAARARGGSVTVHPVVALGKLELEDQRNQGSRLTTEVLGEWYAENLGIPTYHINPLKVKVDTITKVMSFNFAKLHKILCVEVTPGEILVATSEPEKDGWINSIEQTNKNKVTKVFVTPDLIERYTVEFYTIAQSVRGANDKGQSYAGSGVTNFEQLLDLKEDRESSAEDQHIVNIVDWLFQYAFGQRASDIHIEPRRDMGKVRFRIDGVLHDVYEMPNNVSNAVVARIKVLGRMDVAEKRRPQDGRIKTRAPKGTEVELRLSTLPTAFGEKMVMRIFDPEVLMRSFPEMGLQNQDLELWNGLISNTAGIVLVTGPTGSGKTTTLYTSLRKVATADVNVSTLEDPIEMVVEDFNQTQVQPNIELDFARGIRTLLRQDPDIIMVGEIRDRETADMAVQAALTGHLVLSTLHTNDAPAAITRLLDLGLPSHLIRVTLNGVMAQRLVRTLCPSCKREVDMNEDAWNSLVVPFKADKPSKMYEPVGCLDCRNTGYKGREGIYEIMIPTGKIRELITDDTNLESIRRQSFKDGSLNLRLAGARKVAAGKTTIEEVLRVTPVADSY